MQGHPPTPPNTSTSGRVQGLPAAPLQTLCWFRAENQQSNAPAVDPLRRISRRTQSGKGKCFSTPSSRTCYALISGTHTQQHLPVCSWFGAPCVFDAAVFIITALKQKPVDASPVCTAPTLKENVFCRRKKKHGQMSRTSPWFRTQKEWVRAMEWFSVPGIDFNRIKVGMRWQQGIF